MKILSANLLCSATCALTVIFLSGCGEEPGIRRYQERTLPPASTSAKVPNPHTGNPLMKAPDVPTDQAPMDKPTGPLSWDLPEGWIAMPPAGMRYATIIADPQERTIQCAVFIFGKQGGRYANIERWAGQLGVKKTKAELVSPSSSPSSPISRKVKKYRMPSTSIPTATKGTWEYLHCRWFSFYCVSAPLLPSVLIHLSTSGFSYER